METGNVGYFQPGVEESTMSPIERRVLEKCASESGGTFQL